MRAIRSAVILPMIAGSTMAASPFVDPKGFSCSDRTPPATSSPVSATRPALSRPSPPILLFGSPLRKLQPSQLAIEATKPKRAANEAACRPALAPKTPNPLSLPPIPHWLVEELPTPLAPSPVALLLEDSPMPLSSSSTSPPSSQPTVDSSSSTLETSAVDPDPPLLGTPGEAASSFKKAMGSGNMQATTNQLVQPHHDRKPPPLSLASLVRAFQLNWMRHQKPKEPPPEAPRPTPLAPSPVALALEDSPPPLPSSPYSHGSYTCPPSECPKTPDEASIYCPDSPPDHPLGELTGGKKNPFKK